MYTLLTHTHVNYQSTLGMWKVFTCIPTFENTTESFRFVTQSLTVTLIPGTANCNTTELTSIHSNSICGERITLVSLYSAFSSQGILYMVRYCRWNCKHSYISIIIFVHILILYIYYNINKIRCFYITHLFIRIKKL